MEKVTPATAQAIHRDLWGARYRVKFRFGFWIIAPLSRPTCRSRRMTAKSPFFALVKSAENVAMGGKQTFSAGASLLAYNGKSGHLDGFKTVWYAATLHVRSEPNSPVVDNRSNGLILASRSSSPIAHWVVIALAPGNSPESRLSAMSF